MNSYLITGGAGFIGSHFVEYLLKKEKNSQIIILDKLTYAGEKERIQGFLDSENLKFYEGDINNTQLIRSILIEYNVNKIINFAAETHVDRSIKAQKEFVETNVLGVQSLLSVSKEVWDELKLKDISFTQISTDEVYGSSTKKTEELFDENHFLNPMNPYSASKASAEFLIKAFMNTFNYPANIIRSTNNYGTNQNEEKFIPKIITSYLKNEPIIIYGDGLNKRCWLSVKDNCRGIYSVVNEKINQVYNIKGDFTTTNIDLAKRIMTILRYEYQIESQSKIIFVEDRKGHDYFYNVSDKKIKEALGFNLKVTFHEGIKKVIEDHLNGKESFYE